MSFEDIVVEATEAGIFENIYGKQSVDNTNIEQPDVLEYEEPSIYSSQFSASPHFVEVPVCPALAECDDFSFGYLQPGAVDELWNRTFTSTAASRPASTSPPTSQLTSLAPNYPRSSLSPPTSIFPMGQIGIQGKKPQKGTNCHSYDYKPLNIAPTSWDIFEYNCFGELNPGRTYSVKELVRYLYSNPQNHVGETYNPKLGGLTLWVQRTPQDFAAEYGHPEACLCRFENCEHSNLIKVGDVRVAFDELTKLNPSLNPQHNAGYVHLSCLEKEMNFPMLCKDLDVKPEARILPLGRTHDNPMILEDRTELEHVQRFITFCNDMGRAPQSYPSQGLLIDEILRLRPKALAPKLRRKRGVRRENENKAKNQHAKNVLKTKRDGAWAKKGVAKKKRARAEEEINTESDEDHSREKVKARAIIRPRGRTRRALPTPLPESDFDCSSLTELDSESEEESRKRVKFAPTIMV